MRKTISTVTLILANVIISQSVFADNSSDDEWQEIKSSRVATEKVILSADDNDDGGWKEIKSDTYSDNDVAESDSSQSLPEKTDVEPSPSLLVAVEKPAEPLILDFGTEGSKSKNAKVATEPAATNDQSSSDVGPSELPVTNIDMFVGQLLVLGKVDVTRVAIGNGGIVRAELLKTNELLVIGQQEGSTSLRLWNKDDTQTAYNIRVGATDPETRVHMERMVRLRVRMVEFNKRAIGKLGIDWGDNGVANGPTFAAAGDAIGNNLFRPAADGFSDLPNQVAPFTTYFGIATNITSKINFLSGNGDAVTLAEPVLSAVNGGQASFLAGGEIPYPTRGDGGQTTVEFKEYGVRLQVAPSIDAGGNVRTLVDTEISKVDTAVSINGVPGLLTRRAQTEVNVRSGETIVIAGLLTSEDGKETSGIPGLRHLPVIGKLFSSESKTGDVRELVIFITPEVVEPQRVMSSSEKAIYEKSTRRIESARQSLPLME